MTRTTYRNLRRRLEAITEALEELSGQYSSDESISSQLLECATVVSNLAMSVKLKRDPLPVAQQRVLSFIRKHLSDSGQMPTRREISFGLNFADSAAQFHLQAMERNGWIRLKVGEARGIELIGEAQTTRPKLALRK